MPGTYWLNNIGSHAVTCAMSGNNPAERNRNHASAASVHATDATALSSLSYDDPLAILGSAPYPDAPWWKRISPSTIFVLLASAIAVFFLLHELTIAGKLGFPSDESWIDQVYARNFFHHVAFEFNVGERTAGPTSPLWVVFLSMGVGLFHDPIIAGKLLGTIFLFLTAYYTFRLLRTTGNDYGSSLLGGVLIATASQLAWAELSGLESTLSAALVAGGMWWYFANPHGWRRALTGAVFGLAALTRPETALVFVLILAFAAIGHFREVRRGLVTEGFWREAALMIALFLLVITPVGLTNLAIAGAIIPETFYAGMGSHSALRLIEHGEILEFGARVLRSVFSIGRVCTDIYARENPVWLITIVFAWFLRRKSTLIARDASDNLFSLSLFVLLLFPFFRSLTLGTDDNFGEYGRWMHFILPVYAAAGIASLRILVRYGVYRKYSPKQFILYMGLLLVVAGAAFLFVTPTATASYSTIPPVIDYLLVIFFTVLLLIVGLHHAGIPLLKKEFPTFVTEEERGRMTFTLQQGSDEEARLSDPMVRMIRAVLLISLGWNLAELPRAANDFAENVHEMNVTRLPLAQSISTQTAPTDVIATNAIGAIAWVSERRMIDICGHLTKEPTHNSRVLGAEQGLVKTLADTKPQFLAVAGGKYSRVIAHGLEVGYLREVSKNLYKLDQAAAPRMAEYRSGQE